MAGMGWISRLRASMQRRLSGAVQPTAASITAGLETEHRPQLPDSVEKSLGCCDQKY